MYSLEKAVFATILIGVITYITRLLPFALFSKKDPPAIVVFIERYIPPMVMVILVLYCLKEVEWASVPYGIPELFCIIVAAFLHIWMSNPLISIFGSTILYMVIVQSNFISSFL